MSEALRGGDLSQSAPVTVPKVKKAAKKAVKTPEPKPDFIREPRADLLERHMRNQAVSIRKTDAGWFVIDPFNGKKLTDAAKTEEEAVTLRNKVQKYEQAELEKYFAETVSAINLLRSQGYTVVEPE